MNFGSIIKIFRRIITHHLIVKILDYLIPKSPNIWIFGSQGCQYFYDNSMYLFDYVIRHNKEKKIYWVTQDHTTKDQISRIYGPKVMLNPFTIKGLICILRAKVVFVSFHKGDIFYNTITNKKRTIVQLWHGIMMKKMGLTDKSLSIKQKKSLIKNEFGQYSFIIVSSTIEQDTVSLCFGIPLDNVKITGYSRNDYLVNPAKYEELLNCYNVSYDKVIKKIRTYDKVLLYAPTLRQYKQYTYKFTRDELSDINNFLKRRNALLFLRTHAGNNIQENVADNPVRQEYQDLNYSNIQQLNHDILLDIQFILPYIDILITDYSGIYFDYLLLNRPVIFLPCDYEEYEKTRGFLFDYKLITAGPKVKNVSELKEWIDRYINDPAIHENLRKNMKNWFHEFYDGCACERIIRLVK